jgi:hypothetical protein
VGDGGSEGEWTKGCEREGGRGTGRVWNTGPKRGDVCMWSLMKREGFCS